MKQVEIDILNLENKLLQDRKTLNHLIYQCQVQGVSQDIWLNKLENMQRETAYMESQLDMFRKALQKEPESQNASAGVSVESVGIKENAEPDAAVGAGTNDDKGIFSSEDFRLLSLPQKPQNALPKTDTRDLEKAFGRSGMGVIASGLVFISFIFFAVMLFPVLTDGMKIAAMFAISFIFAGVGFAKLCADRENKFYLALCGCGVGAVYISILTSNIFFRVINDIVLYLLVFVWAVCVCCLRRMGSILFQLIGQIGIIIAINFGCRVCIAVPIEAKVLMLVLFFAVTSMVFLAAYRQKELAENGISLVFNLVNLCQLLWTLMALPDSAAMKAVSVILFGYAALHFVFCYRCEVSQDGLDFGIVTMVCVVLETCILAVLLRNVPSKVNVADVTALVFCILALVVAERRLDTDAGAGRAAIQIASMLLMYYAVRDMEVLDEHVYLAALMIPFLCAGFLKRNWYFKYGSIVYVFDFLLNGQMHNPEKMLWGFVYFGLLIYFMLREKTQYQSLFKLSAYCAFLLKIMLDCVYIMHLFGADIYTAQILVCIVIGGLNMLLSRTGQMGRNPVSQKPEQETAAVLKIVHAVQMGVVTGLILLPPAKYSNVICIPWAVALYLFHTKDLLVRAESKAGVYVGIKFTVLLTAVLVSCDAARVLASICYFVLSVICIVCGFRVQCKPLRIYGLALSMLSVLKLTLVDIAFGGLLQLAAGFFVAGILCFAINRIYNSIDEKMKSFSALSKDDVL